jgi:hypothetical protein
MKQHKPSESDPADVPHLREVGYTVTYDYVVVTPEYLREMKVKLAAAPDAAKYGIFRTRLFYGNLRRWQKQGLHILYTSGPGTQHCTCGLVLHENGSLDQESAVVLSEKSNKKLDGIELEQIQMVRGHKGLPSLKGEAVALIINFNYKDAIADYLWTVICQECGDYQIDVKNMDAKSFVKSHNRICGEVLFAKKDG